MASAPAQAGAGAEAMAVDGQSQQCKGYFATANGDNFGPLNAYLQMLGEGCKAVAAQEHHVAEAEVP